MAHGKIHRVPDKSDLTAANNVVAFDENGKLLGLVFETATPFDTPRMNRSEVRRRTLHICKEGVTH